LTPIKGISDRRKMPRLGKIHLGIKVEPPDKNPYPRATDYFVVPDEIKQYVGDKPTKLNIMFPGENPEDFAPQWLKCYSFTQGLVCRGNGVMCRRKVDTMTGARASHTTEEWIWEDGLPCDPDTCPDYSSDRPQCRRVMNLLFLMPDVPGFGVWQLDTSSFYSILNLNSSLDLIKRLCGRISFIPLTLSLEPQVVEPPGIKKKTVHILNIRSDIKLADIQRIGRRKPEVVLLPQAEEEEIPGDLYPDEVLAQAEGVAPVSGQETPAPPTTKPQLEKSPKDVVEDDIPNWDTLFKACFHFWKMQPAAVAKELGYSDVFDLHRSKQTPWEGWLSIMGTKRLGAAANAAGAAEPVEQEGFGIDLPWLRDALKRIKWTDDTAKTFLVSKYKVSPQGTLLDVLSRLTRVQAEEFLEDIKGRLEKQQATLF